MTTELTSIWSSSKPSTAFNNCNDHIGITKLHPHISQLLPQAVGKQIKWQQTWYSGTSQILSSTQIFSAPFLCYPRDNFALAGFWSFTSFERLQVAGTTKNSKPELPTPPPQHSVFCAWQQVSPSVQMCKVYVWMTWKKQQIRKNYQKHQLLEALQQFDVKVPKQTCTPREGIVNPWI